MTAKKKSNKVSDQSNKIIEECRTQVDTMVDVNDILNCKITSINNIISLYRKALNDAISERLIELESDKNEHFLIYHVLGIDSKEEHYLIDKYQNIGRFVYKYAGALLEDLASLCLSGEKIYFENTVSSSPKKFEIDCYTEKDNKAHEIKWRDATTDGDHTRKEENKVKGILGQEYIPVRVMFFMPQRKQAIKIQEKITSIYKENGEAYIDDEAFQYILDYSGIDLKKIFTNFIKEELDS